MRSPLALISTSIALLVAAAPGLATATPTYPSVIKTELDLSYTPPCTLCHQSAGGGGMLTRPFGIALQGQGLKPFDDASLTRALDAIDVDSDCDGTSDIDQLKEGRDPNTGAYLDGSDKPAPEKVDCNAGPEIPRYGCAAQITASPSSSSGALASAAAVAALLGLTLVRRRRA